MLLSSYFSLLVSTIVFLTTTSQIDCDDGFRRELNAHSRPSKNDVISFDDDLGVTSSTCGKLNDVHNLVVRLTQEHLLIKDDVAQLQRRLNPQTPTRPEVQLRHANDDVSTHDVMKRLKTLERHLRRLQRALAKSDHDVGTYANVTRDVGHLQQVLDHFTLKQTDINSHIAKRMRDVEQVLRSDDDVIDNTG